MEIEKLKEQIGYTAIARKELQEATELKRNLMARWEEDNAELIGRIITLSEVKEEHEAKIAVNVFKGVIELKPKKVIINGEQYLEYEDWQTLGEFYRCSAITRDAVPIEVNGVQGAKARADLVNIDTGIIIGGASVKISRADEDG